MKVVDERTKGPRRNLLEVNLGDVVRLDDRDGFWMRKYGVHDNDEIMLINLQDAMTLYQPFSTKVTLVTATVTITDG